MTVGELKKLLEGVDDSIPVMLHKTKRGDEWWYEPPENFSTGLRRYCQEGEYCVHLDENPDDPEDELELVFKID